MRRVALPAVAVASAQFAPFTTENDARNTVPTFDPIELRQGSLAHVLVVDVAQPIEGFVNAPEFRDALRQSSGIVAHLKGSHDTGSRYSSL